MILNWSVRVKETFYVRCMCNWTQDGFHVLQADRTVTNVCIQTIVKEIVSMYTNKSAMLSRHRKLSKWSWTREKLKNIYERVRIIFPPRSRGYHISICTHFICLLCCNICHIQLKVTHLEIWHSRNISYGATSSPLCSLRFQIIDKTFTFRCFQSFPGDWMFINQTIHSLCTVGFLSVKCMPT